MENLALKKMGVNRLFHWIGKIAFKLTGWQTEGRIPDIPKAVVIVAHHTSNWDFLAGLMATYIWRVKPFWLAKHSLFRWPMGGLLKWLGGIPINRATAHNVVEQAAQAFQNYERFLLAITPEGTRKKVNQWKSGFYHIAKAAKVPIVCGFIDYKRKVTGIGPTIFPTDDIRADMEKIREFYSTVNGKYPELAGNVEISLK
jgi:1-acyl-sn-glycerol-3-phosphate acyltransferase